MQLNKFNLVYYIEDLNKNKDNIVYELGNKRKGIYVFVCLVNNKIYIGSSINLKRRFKTHITINIGGELRSNLVLRADKIKYGINNFGFGIYEYKDDPSITLKNIIDLEQFYLNQLFKESLDLFYNINEDAIGSFRTYNKGPGKLRSRAGENNSMFGRIGELNPQFGIKPTNSIRTGLFNESHQLVKEFRTKKDAYIELNKDS